MPAQNSQWVQGQDGNWYYVNQSGTPLYMVTQGGAKGSLTDLNLYTNPNVPSGQTQLGVDWNTLPAEVGAYLNQLGVNGYVGSENGGAQNTIYPVTQDQLNQAAQNFGYPSVPSNWQTSQITVPGAAAPAPTNDIFSSAPQGSPIYGQKLAFGPGQQGVSIIPNPSSGGFGGDIGSALGIGGGLGDFLNTAGNFMMDPGTRTMLPVIAGGVIAGGGTTGAATDPLSASAGADLTTAFGGSNAITPIASQTPSIVDPLSPSMGPDLTTALGGTDSLLSPMMTIPDPLSSSSGVDLTTALGGAPSITGLADTGTTLGSTTPVNTSTTFTDPLTPSAGANLTNSYVGDLYSSGAGMDPTSGVAGNVGYTPGASAGLGSTGGLLAGGPETGGVISSGPGSALLGGAATTAGNDLLNNLGNAAIGAGTSGLDLAIREAPGLAALAYAGSQPGLDTSSLESILASLNGNTNPVIQAATDPFQQNIAAGYGDLLQSQGLRGIRGSSFGTTDIANYLGTTGRALSNAGANAAQGSLALQGTLAGNIANLKNQAQQIKNNLYGRAFDVLGRGLNPSSYGTTALA